MSPFAAALGGLFALMTLAHFVFDWLPQPESWAMVKHRDAGVRWLHSLFYALPMAVVIDLLTHSTNAILLAFVVLAVSHFLEDTYWFPVWWLKNVRRAKGPMTEGLNLVLLIVVDQLVHLATLLLACYIALIG